ncbi:MAG: hypothetical protein ACLPKE_01710 [Streptosporangiaceae bacterium]
MASTLSVGLAISLASAVYTDFYLPSAVAPLLTVSVNIGKAAVDNAKGAATIPISVTLRNRQSIGVYILAAYYDVAGRSFTGISPGSLTTEQNAAAQRQSFGSFVNDYSYHLIQVHPQQAVYLWYMLPPLSSAEPYFPQLDGTVCGTGAEFTAPTAAEVLSRQGLYGLQREGGGELTTALPSNLGIPVKR